MKISKMKTEQKTNPTSKALTHCLKLSKRKC